MLISVRSIHNHSNESSDSSDEEVVSESVLVDWCKKFIETIFAPALANLSAMAPSRMKGAGNLKSKKWHVHHSDWTTISFYADKIAREKNVFEQCL